MLSNLDTTANKSYSKLKELNVTHSPYLYKKQYEVFLRKFSAQMALFWKVYWVKSTKKSQEALQDN